MTIEILQAQIDALTKQVRELKAWKESAMAVDRQWDPQALAVMLGAKPGDDTRVVIQREVPKLVRRAKKLEEETADYQTLYSNWKAYATNLEDAGQEVFECGIKPNTASKWLKAKATRP